MNATTSSPKAQYQTKTSAKTLSVSAGFAQLKRLADESPLKTYIEDHEAWALVLLTLLMIVGTVLYGDFQPPPGSPSVQAQASPALKLAETPVQQQASIELPSPPVQETPLDLGSSISDPPSQASALVSPGKRNSQLIKRKSIHHHHRR